MGVYAPDELGCNIKCISETVPKSLFQKKVWWIHPYPCPERNMDQSKGEKGWGRYWAWEGERGVSSLGCDIFFSEDNDTSPLREFVSPVK